VYPVGDQRQIDVDDLLEVVVKADQVVLDLGLHVHFTPFEDAVDHVVVELTHKDRLFDAFATLMGQNLVGKKWM